MVVDYVKTEYIAGLKRELDQSSRFRVFSLISQVTCKM